MTTPLMMRWALIGVLTIHGLLHLLGVAKAFGHADLPQLTHPIARHQRDSSAGRSFGAARGSVDGGRSAPVGEVVLQLSLDVQPDLIRSAPDAAWMPFEAEQRSFADEPTRLFVMRARMFGMPVEAFHRLIDGHATMRVTAAGVVPIVNDGGDEMDRAETVTLFNDMCILAPGTLVDPGIRWEPVDASTARATFTQHGHAITATLFFAADGRLVNFESDDRARSAPDSRLANARFSTPLRDYREFGPLYLAGYGEARWRLPEGEFTYGEFTMLEVVANDTSGRVLRQSSNAKAP